jgi:hypothetical protein
MIFGRDRKVEFKKSFELYRQILLNEITKVSLNFVHFALTKASKNEA